MAGPRRSNSLVLGWITGFDRQFLFPVFPVAIDDLNGNGRADGFAVPHAGEDVDLVGFNLHASAAAIALLAAPEFAVHKIKVYGDASRQSGNERNQCLAVGFAGCGETDHIDSIVTEGERTGIRE